MHQHAAAYAYSETAFVWGHTTHNSQLRALQHLHGDEHLLD